MTKRQQTIAVRTREGRRAVIEAAAFDPAVHEPWRDAAPEWNKDAESLDAMSRAELLAMARRLRIPGRGAWTTKDELRAGIAAYLKTEEA